jgi:hypothetical protein
MEWNCYACFASWLLCLLAGLWIGGVGVLTAWLELGSVKK